MPTAHHFPAPEAADVARQLMQYHADLLKVRVEFVFRNEAIRKDGQVTWGRAHKVTGFKAMLATADADRSDGCDFYVIELAHDVWKLLTPQQRLALVDHELCHLELSVTESGRRKLGMRPHDVEEFIEIIQRHGAWRPDITQLIAAAGPQQLRLIADSLDELGQTRWENLVENVAEVAEGLLREQGIEVTVTPGTARSESEADAADQMLDAETEPKKDKVSDTERSVFGLNDEPANRPEPPPVPDDTELALRARPIVVTTQVASVHLLMRRLHVTEATANRVLAKLEADGIVGPDRGGNKPREVLIRPDGDDPEPDF